MAEEFDAIVIGTGQSGPSLAQRLTSEGAKTATIERKLFGETCVNVGCIPTKTLVASARAAYVARRGHDFGVVIDGSVRVDMRKVKARKDAVVKQSHDGVTHWLKGMPNLTVHEGHARERGETRGFMKALIDAETKKILGAAILGIGGDEIIHSLLYMMYANAPYTTIQRAMHIHPTVTELIPTMLADLRPLPDM